MKEIHDIIQKMHSVSPQKLVIATIVKVEGSTYRRPGARMLITENGDITGTVSGGCLEEDIKEKACVIFKTEKTQLITYDMMSDEDIVWGLGLGCNGIVQVLLQCIHSSKIPVELQYAIDCYEQEKVGFIAIRFSNSNNKSLGATTCYNKQNISDIWKKILNKYPTILQKNQKSKIIQLTIKECREEILIEKIIPMSLLIFGAGFDAIPLANIAKKLGWKVTIFDHRETYLNLQRFPSANKRILAHPQDKYQHSFNKNQYAVIMTHNYHHDLEILKQLSTTSLTYIGMLGPKKRTNKIIADIEKNNPKLPQEKIYGPIGLDIGSETPEEIALAIVAEILAMKNNKNGSYLKQNKGSIH